MRVIIDTNIVFSAIISPQGKIHDLILNSGSKFELFAPTFLINELEKHDQKLREVSKFSDSQLSFTKRIILNSINFIDSEIIRVKNWAIAFALTSDIDEKDTPFVSLTLEIDGFLWTGDKKLSNGLKRKGIDWVSTTDDLAEFIRKN